MEEAGRACGRRRRGPPVPFLFGHGRTRIANIFKIRDSEAVSRYESKTVRPSFKQKVLKEEKTRRQEDAIMFVIKLSCKEETKKNAL